LSLVVFVHHELTPSSALYVLAMPNWLCLKPKIFLDPQLVVGCQKQNYRGIWNLGANLVGILAVAMGLEIDNRRR